MIYRVTLLVGGARRPSRTSTTSSPSLDEARPLRYPVSFNVDQSKRRGYALYLILSVVTFGIWGLVWDYKIHNDPDNL